VRYWHLHVMFSTALYGKANQEHYTFVSPHATAIFLHRKCFNVNWSPISASCLSLTARGRRLGSALNGHRCCYTSHNLSPFSSILNGGFGIDIGKKPLPVVKLFSR
jgi:hypothetical protein